MILGSRFKRCCLFIVAIFAFNVLSMVGQNAFTSVKINIHDVKISADSKTISYDVYLQDVDASYAVAVPGYGVRLAVPATDLDTLKAKTVSLTNPCALIGARLPTMSVIRGNWVMKFQNNTSPLSYDAALLISETFPGTRLATFNFRNADSTAFANPQQFTATFAGTSPATKTSVSVFLEGLVSLAPNSTAAQPATNISGLGLYSLKSSQIPITITGVTAADKIFNGNNIATLSGGSLVGVDSGNVVTIVAGTGSFADRNIGTAKTVTATGYTLGGADASKYVLSGQPGGLTANITALSLTISAPKVTLQKIYDATTTAAVTPGTLSGVLSADAANVTVNATATYDNVIVGTGKTITVSYSLSGSAAINYIAPTSTSLITGIIILIPKQLSVKAYLEGFWNGLSMNKAQEYDGVYDLLFDKFPGTIVDTLTVELHDVNTYGTVLHSVNGLELHQDGSITSPGVGYIAVPGENNLDYRIAINHRNYLMVASASSVSLSTPTTSYDFTDSSVKTYKPDGISFTPTKLLNGKWMLYVANIKTGDDPVINNDNLYETFDRNSLGTRVYGYLLADVNGDGFVDNSDFYLKANNLLIFFGSEYFK